MVIMLKMKRLLRLFKDKIIKPIHDFVIKNSKALIYIMVFLVGLILISLSFLKLETNWNNVCCGVGTGILTSLFVTIIVNAENEAREKRKTEREKHFLLNDIILSSLDVYEDVTYRINEFITLSELKLSEKYCFYEDFKQFNEFANYLKSLNIESLSEQEKERLDKLFNFRNYRIDYLISNIKHLPRQEYFLRGILTQEEYHGFVSQSANDSYLSYAEHINEFWRDEVLDLEKCIYFLRMTLYITTKIISTFDYALKRVKAIEDNIKEAINQLYFDEVYSKSDEYIQNMINRGEAECEYYASHPEEAEELERFFEKTEEDWILDDLYSCLFGFEACDIRPILNKLDKSSQKVKDFFKQEQIQKGLCHKHKAKKIILKTYGKDYLKKSIYEENKDITTSCDS